MKRFDAQMVARAGVASHHRRALIFSLCSLLLAGGCAAWQLSSWPVRLRYPGEWCGIEGMRLAEMQHLREGIPIYAAGSAERFDATIYGPLYYLVGSRLIDPGQPAYLPLRVLATLGTLGCAAASGLLAFGLGRRFLAAALAPLIGLSYGFVTFYGTSSRPDSLALCLSLAGVLVAYRFRESPKILLAMPIFLAAFFYKQQFVAAPLAAFAFLILEKRFRRAAVFAGLMISGVLGLLALFQFVVFPHQAFFEHFYFYNLLPFSWTQFKGGVILFALLFVVPLLVGWECVRVHRDRFFACYLTAAVIIALLAVGKEGSDTNYFLESILVLASLYAALLAERIAQPARAIELLVLLTVTLFAGQFFMPSAPRPEDFVRDAALQDYLRKHFPPRTRALGYYTGDLLRAGLETPISDLYQYAQLARKGALSDRDLAAALERREFGVITLTFDLRAGKDEGCKKRYLTERLAKAIAENYQPAASLELPSPEQFHSDDQFHAWVPRPDAPATSQAAPHL
jgi:hypothetical protein